LFFSQNKGYAIFSFYPFPQLSILTPYDADKKVLNVAVVLKTIIEGGLSPLQNYEKRVNSLNSPSRSVTVKSNIESRKYLASNAFGVQTQVEEIQSDNFQIDISNWKSFNPTKYVEEIYSELYKEGISSGDKALIESANLLWNKDAFVFGVNLDVATAKKIRNNLKVLFVGKLTSPYHSASSQSTEATVNKPTAFKRRNYYLNVELLQVWIYDITTGIVYAKIPNETLSTKQANNSNPQISKQEKNFIRSKIPSGSQLEMEVDALLVKLKNLINKFKQNPSYFQTESGTTELIEGVSPLMEETKRLENYFPDGEMKKNFQAVSMGIGIAGFFLYELRGVNLIPEESRGEITQTFQLQNVSPTERPSKIIDTSKVLLDKFEKSWNELKSK
jgi:hypothetical protein